MAQRQRNLDGKRVFRGVSGSFGSSGEGCGVIFGQKNHTGTDIDLGKHALEIWASAVPVWKKPYGDRHRSGAPNPTVV